MMITSRTAMVIVAALLVISYVSSFLNPAKFWLLTIFGMCFLPLAIINFILLFWALSRRSKSFIIPLLALLPSFLFMGRYVQIFTSSEKIQNIGNAHNIKLITYNVGRFSARKEDGKTREGISNEIFTFLKKENPDIVCLQEVWVKDMRTVKAYFSKMMPGYQYRYCLSHGANGNFGNVTFSRFPIIDSGKLTFDKSANMAIYTDIESDSGLFRVYNCHFESYNISLPHLVKSLGTDHHKVLKETGDKLEASITRRPEQVNKVLNNINSSQKTSIVCGDFNDTPMSYTYNQLMKGRKDSFVEAGDGFGATYDYMWPALRIDYALFPEEYNVFSHYICKVGYSDHYPVITHFLI